MKIRGRKFLQGPREVPMARPGAEKLPELSNSGFEKRLGGSPPRGELLRYSSHARFLARWSAP
ncbi:MAG: hypothetical protein ABJC07_05185 [Acidobacteriota bacterium]